jgi:hypothetical protein
MSSGQLHNTGGIGRNRIGQSQVMGWFTQLRHELVETPGRQHQDCSARACLGDIETMRDSPRQVHKRAGTGVPSTVPAEAFELAVQYKEDFVAHFMDVRRWRKTRRHPVINDAQATFAVLGTDLIDRQGVQKPERFPLVGRHHEPIRPVRSAISIHKTPLHAHG